MIDIGAGVDCVTRGEWGARAARSVTFFNPTYGGSAHWEGPHMGVFPHTSCAAKIRGIQGFHMDRRLWSDIAYNMLVCPHGVAFMGRGPGVRSAANGTTLGNSTAHALCYLGGERDGITAAGEHAMHAALDYLDRMGGGPRRNGHRDWKNTQCPGDEIYGLVHAAWQRPLGPAPAPTPVPGTPTPPTTPLEGFDMDHIVRREGDNRVYWVRPAINKRMHFNSQAAIEDVVRTHSPAVSFAGRDGAGRALPKVWPSYMLDFYAPARPGDE